MAAFVITIMVYEVDLCNDEKCNKIEDKLNISFFFIKLSTICVNIECLPKRLFQNDIMRMRIEIYGRDYLYKLFTSLLEMMIVR